MCECELELALVPVLIPPLDPLGAPAPRPGLAPAENPGLGRMDADEEGTCRPNAFSHKSTYSKGRCKGWLLAGRYKRRVSPIVSAVEVRDGCWRVDI